MEHRLGVGGMGEVHLARHRLLDRQVAIKHIRLDVDSDLKGRKRLRREARAAARLSHPAVVQIHDLLESNDGDWIVMEYVDGPTLGQLLAQDGPLDVARTLDLGRQVAEGLAASHEQGVLHRDLKSDNIILEGVGSRDPWRARILDFGLAKVLWWHADSDTSSHATSLTAHGEVMGTCRAMSPEQARGLPLDGRSDLFALGSLLYEMLTEVSPFQADSPVATMTRVVSHEPAPVHHLVPGIPAEVAHFIGRLMRKAADDRPANGWRVARELERLARVGSGPSRRVDGTRRAFTTGASTPGASTPGASSDLGPDTGSRGRAGPPDENRPTDYRQTENQKSGSPGPSTPSDRGPAPISSWSREPLPLAPLPRPEPSPPSPGAIPALAFWLALLLALAVGWAGGRGSTARSAPGSEKPAPGAAGQSAVGESGAGESLGDAPRALAPSPAATATDSRAQGQPHETPRNPAASEASQLRAAAALLWDRGWIEPARSNLQLAVELLRRGGDTAGLAQGLADLALSQWQEDLARQRPRNGLLEEAQRAADRSGSLAPRLRTAALLAEFHRQAGAFDLARRQAMTVLDLVPGTLLAGPLSTDGPLSRSAATAMDPESSGEPQRAPLAEADIALAYLVLSECETWSESPRAARRWLGQADRALASGSPPAPEPRPEPLRERLALALEQQQRHLDADVIRNL